MSEVLSIFCDRQRAFRPLKERTVLTFLVRKSKMKHPVCLYFFLRLREKSKKSNLILVVVLISSLNLKVSNIVMTKTSFQMLEVLSFCDLNLLE